MENIDKIINTIHELNKISWLDWIQLIFNVVTTFVTIVIAVLAYKLQKQTKIDEDKERRLNDVQHVSNVYYFLNDIINKMADIEFEYTTFDNIVVEGKQYMDDINYLRNRYITNEEFGLLRELYALYDGIRTNPKQNRKNFKLLYKKVIDISIEPSEIPVHRDSNNYDFITSIQVLMISKKLERTLNDSVEVLDDRINFEIDNGQFIMKKFYDKEHYIENYNGMISGYIKRYESVMHYGDDQIRLAHELIYDGEINDNVFDGNGKYYYYSSKNGFVGKIDSCNLNIKGVNYDEIAQTIKSKLQHESNDGHFSGVFSGIFSNGHLKSGKFKYKLNSSSEDCELKVGK